MQSTPPVDSPTKVLFGVERVSDGVMRLTLDNGENHQIGYNLCSSVLERRDGSAWTPVPTNEVCTMVLLTLNPGRDATFEKRLPPDLPAGEYRYRTRIESPLGTPLPPISTAPFTR